MDTDSDSLGSATGREEDEDESGADEQHSGTEIVLEGGEMAPELAAAAEAAAQEREWAAKQLRRQQRRRQQQHVLLHGGGSAERSVLRLNSSSSSNGLSSGRRKTRPDSAPLSSVRSTNRTPFAHGGGAGDGGDSDGGFADDNEFGDGDNGMDRRGRGARSGKTTGGRHGGRRRRNNNNDSSSNNGQLSEIASVTHRGNSLAFGAATTASRSMVTQLRAQLQNHRNVVDRLARTVAAVQAAHKPLDTSMAQLAVQVQMLGESVGSFEVRTPLVRAPSFRRPLHVMWTGLWW